MKMPADRQTPAESGVDEVDSAGRILTLADMVFGFFEDGEGPMESCSNDGVRTIDGEEDEEEEEENSNGRAERMAFWKSQYQILKVSHQCTTQIIYFHLNGADDGHNII